MRWGLIVLMAGMLAVGMAAGGEGADAKKGEWDIQYVEEEQEPTEPPARVIGKEEEERADAVAGTVELSDGTKVSGKIYLTRDKKLAIYDPKEKKRYETTLAELEKIESRVMKEWMEKEWRWKENANDEKVYTGKEYPVREYEVALTFKGGKVIVGECTALLYVRLANSERRFILHKRQKGEVGQKMEEMVYVKTVTLG